MTCTSLFLIDWGFSYSPRREPGTEILQRLAFGWAPQVFFPCRSTSILNTRTWNILLRRQTMHPNLPHLRDRGSLWPRTPSRTRPRRSYRTTELQATLGTDNSPTNIEEERRLRQPHSKPNMDCLGMESDIGSLALLYEPQPMPFTKIMIAFG